MEISKKILGTLDRVYATSGTMIKGELNYLVASEGKGSCIAINSKDFSFNEIWDGPGGTMNIVPIPGREGEFIATQKFLPTFNAKESLIVHGKINSDGSSIVTPIMDIPYLHRFDIFENNGEILFIGATLCDNKEFQDDWSMPGKVYIGKLSNDLTKPFELKPIITGITKNHGFCRTTWGGKKVYLVTGIEGVFLIYVPETFEGEWKVEKLLNHEVSDVAVADIDGDGIEEIATIEPFHGSKGIIYKNIDGNWTPIHTHEYEFGHVVWGGTITEKPSFIIGGRKGKMEIICYQMENGEIKETLIDSTGGASNIAVFNREDGDYILAANRQIGEIGLYKIKL